MSNFLKTFNITFLPWNSKGLLAVVTAGQKQLLKNFAMIRMLSTVHECM